MLRIEGINLIKVQSLQELSFANVSTPQEMMRLKGLQLFIVLFLYIS